MNLDIFYALLLFCFVAGVTPGPNNMMLMSSGVNFGFRRTIPHLAGVVLGFALMVVLVGVGLDAIFTAVPKLLPIMRWAGAVYMVWLAWKIARSGPVEDAAGVGKPLGFLGAAAFQWINPKGWAMAVSALTAYAVSPNYTVSVMVVALCVLVLAVPCSGLWVLFGTGMRRWLSDPVHVKPFNYAMAILLIVSVLPVLWE
jgi:threonine/homoserine/homoserine lactone efflux protein